MWRLRIQGPDIHFEVFLTPGQIYQIGRSGDNQIIVPDLTVSRHHVMLDVKADRIILRDLHSKNGTFVNQNRVEDTCELYGYEDIQIGQIRIFLERVTPSPTPGRLFFHAEAAADSAETTSQAMQRLEHIWKVLTESYHLWIHHRDEDEELAIRKVFRYWMDKELALRFAVLHRPDAHQDAFRTVLDTDIEPVDRTLVTWAFRVAHFSPKPAWYRLSEDTGVVVLPFSPQWLGLIWVYRWMFQSRVMPGLVSIMTWILQEWFTRWNRARLLIGQSLHAWAPFPFWGFSPALHRLLREVLQWAPLATPLALYGPPGVGKTTLARWIHEISRPRSPLLVWDVSDQNDPYTQFILNPQPDTDTARIWWLYHEGTVVVRNLEQATPDVQDALHLWIERPQIVSEGVQRTLHLRWIGVFSTSPDQLQHDGRLLDPLAQFFSKAVIEVPSLQDRRGDLPYLVNYLVQQFSRGRFEGVQDAVVERLFAYDWPGNVRELAEVIRRAVDHALAQTATMPLLQLRHVEPYLPKG